MKLIDLPDNILLHLLEVAPSVTCLANSCSRTRRLWQMPSSRTNWLLRCCASKTQALDLALVYFRDYEVAINLLQRQEIQSFGYTSLWLAHVLVDICRMEPSMPSTISPSASSKQSHHPRENMDESLADLLKDIGMGKPTSAPVSPTDSATLQHSSPAILNPRSIHPDQAPPLTLRFPLHKQMHNHETFPHLLGALLQAGADVQADMTLYLKSLLFGSLSASAETAPLAWLVNEHHRRQGARMDAEAFGTRIEQRSEADYEEGDGIRAGFAAAFLCAHRGLCDGLRVLAVQGKVRVGGFEGLLGMMAARDGRLDVLQVLQESGVDLGQREGRAVELAERNGHILCAQFIRHSLGREE
ncbi:hypothetical protein BC830DRAFT_97361 [Chytriomyces sp. MP71]|nr:hypothetical protein BC830DRAFT_97361 [Chytriomyces sp. MP71]